MTMPSVKNTTVEPPLMTARSHKKRSHPEAESAKDTANKLHCYICAAKPHEGKVLIEYARATIRYNADSATVTCKARLEPSPKMARIFQSTGFSRFSPKKASEFKHPNYVETVHRILADEELTKVTTILVNIHLIDHFNASPIFGGVGGICRSIFPHLNPDLSAVNIHHGFTHWRADDILLKPSQNCLTVTPVLK